MIDAGIGANSASSGAYDITNSVKLEADNSEFFSRTPSSNSNRQNFTFSTWIKRTELGAINAILEAYQDGSNFFLLGIQNDDNLVLYDAISGTDYGAKYSIKLRDTSAWYHIVFRSETTSGTAASRWKIYVNGVEITAKDTDYGTPPRWYQSNLNRTIVHNIGKRQDQNTFMSCYLAETHLVDGTALLPTSFGEFDEDSGIWKPIKVSGVTYGTNGFYLDYTDSSDLGNDANGSNNFAENNLTAADQSTDTPINNFATGNSLNPSGVFTEGATRWVSPTGSLGGDGTWNLASIALTGGKWHCEVKMVSSTNVYYQVGISPTHPNDSYSSRCFYRSDGNIYNAGSGGNTTGHTTYTAGDIIGMSYDASANTVIFSKNGTAVVTKTAIAHNDPYFFGGAALSSGTWTADYNFGGYTSYTISSPESDENGYGTFEYAPPTGYYALCTKNLAEYG